MKHIIHCGLFIIVLTGLSAEAFADKTYIGIDFGVATVELPHATADVRMLRGRFGMVLNPESAFRVGFESHMAFGLKNAVTVRETTNSVEDIEIELESILGLYAKAEFFNVGIMGAYGLLGIAAVQTGPGLPALTDNGTAVLDNDNEPVFNTDSSTGLSYGVGLTIFLAKSISLQIEVLQVQTAEEKNLDFSVSTVTAGINFEL